MGSGSPNTSNQVAPTQPIPSQTTTNKQGKPVYVLNIDTGQNKKSRQNSPQKTQIQNKPIKKPDIKNTSQNAKNQPQDDDENEGEYEDEYEYEYEWIRESEVFPKEWKDEEFEIPKNPQRELENSETFIKNPPNSPDRKIRIVRPPPEKSIEKPLIKPRDAYENAFGLPKKLHESDLIVPKNVQNNNREPGDYNAEEERRIENLINQRRESKNYRELSYGGTGKFEKNSELYQNESARNKMINIMHNRRSKSIAKPSHNDNIDIADKLHDDDNENFRNKTALEEYNKFAPNNKVYEKSKKHLKKGITNNLPSKNQSKFKWRNRQGQEYEILNIGSPAIKLPLLEDRNRKDANQTVSKIHFDGEDLNPYEKRILLNQSQRKQNNETAEIKGILKTLGNRKIRLTDRIRRDADEFTKDEKNYMNSRKTRMQNLSAIQENPDLYFGNNTRPNYMISENEIQQENDIWKNNTSIINRARNNSHKTNATQTSPQLKKPFVFDPNINYDYDEEEELSKKQENYEKEYIPDFSKKYEKVQPGKVLIKTRTAEINNAITKLTKNPKYHFEEPSDTNKLIFSWQNIARQHPEYIVNLLKKRLNNLQFGDTIENIKEALHDMSVRRPVRALKWDDQLFLACRDHANDLGNSGQVSHFGSDGMTVVERVNKYGKLEGKFGENLQISSEIPQDIILSIIIDKQSPTKVNRRNLMSTDFAMGAVCQGIHVAAGVWTVFVYYGFGR